jgi:ribonuclease G
MNKELFVSSTPHETKVGLVEDDLLAEIYLERENEYTLAGSIYKGRVTRVLPGMQSAFVDIGLERDAFLYVSDFMDLEEHDEDLTDTVPANRGVQDMRSQPAQSSPVGVDAGEVTDAEIDSELTADAVEAGPSDSEVTASPDSAPESGNGGDGQNRDLGSFRGRRRRGRGGRRDRFDRGGERGTERSAADRGPEGGSERTSERGPERSERSGGERGSESRYSRPSESFRGGDSGRTQPSGPPPGYTPILLPGESISKYQRYAQPAAVSEPPVRSPAESRVESSPAAEAPLAATFPEDEPIFARGGPTMSEVTSEVASEPLHEEHEHVRTEEHAEASAAAAGWRQEFRRPEPAWDEPVRGEREPAAASSNNNEQREPAVEREANGNIADEVHEADITEDVIVPAQEHTDQPRREEQAPAFAAPGTMEEETIDEEEADTIRYESSSDDSYDEFEEETQAAAGHLNGDAREAVAEIHQSALAEVTGGAAPVGHAAESAPESEEDSEELELEEAQAEAEAILDAEARGNGTVDARVEVRAPAGTAEYTQRAPRPAWERRGGQRGRRGGGGGGARRFRRRESAPVPLISDLLKEGQEILVQIAKEPIGKKGARITSHIALPGRFLVYMPTVNHTGVSRKIASEEERQRLKRIIMSERENGHGGFIVRTAAQSASEDELRADIRFLKGLWQDIKNRAENSKPPALIYHDLNVVERVLRDQVTSDFSVIWVDTESEYERVLRFFNRFQPALVKRVKLYTKETPLFEQFGLKEEMDKALKSKVWLKSGGYIVINQTEALVAIDINTGKYVGKTARLEDTIVKTNVDAIKEIVRQIRLRDLGGIIIIDFIDMDERRNRQRVMQALEEELRHDRAPSKTLQFNDFGLVAITRKRVKQSLERTIGAPCPYCQSTGYVKSVGTICNEIYVEMRKIAKHLEHEDVMLRVHPDVAKELKGNNGRLLNEMEELTKRTIIVKSDPAVHQEQFDIN